MTTLMSGKLYHCELDHTGLTLWQQTELIKDKWDCLSYGGEWENADSHYDTTLHSMLDLFILQTRERFSMQMWMVVDVVGVD